VATVDSEAVAFAMGGRVSTTVALTTVPVI
jgi:hypothetical protein